MNSYGDTFSGTLDEVRLSTRALTSGEINALYQTTNTYYTTGTLQQKAQSTTVTNGLIARYSFDASTGTDDSGNGNTGSVLNGVIFSGGKIATGAVFDGNDDKVQLTTPLISGAGDFAISAWIQRTTSGAGVAHDIAGNYGVSACGGGAEFYVYQDHLYLYIGSPVIGTATIDKNTRYHVTATRTSGLVSLYVNGALDKTGTLTASITTGCNRAIGNGPNYTSEAFSGYLDEVRMYNRALSTGEIYELYASAQSLYLTGECNDTTATLHP